MKNLSILFGVCGIGRGHIYEMLPIVEHYISIPNCRIVIFAFGQSYEYFKSEFPDSERIKVLPVTIPWIHGSLEGLDYKKTSEDEFNQRNDFVSENFKSMGIARAFLGTPNVVITDYEPVSAQFAYSLNCPLVTVDQQSKYLFPTEPSVLAGLSPNEEHARLSMFFPRVDLRIINSFFKIPKISEPQKFQSEIFGPIIRKEVQLLKKGAGYRHGDKKILVYLSPYSPFVQPAEELLEIFKQFSYEFVIFSAISNDLKLIQTQSGNSRIRIEDLNDEKFLEELGSCDAIISTAGHTLLSEAMYLAKPVLAVPLRTFEQHYSAHIIAKGGYGMTQEILTATNVGEFIKSIETFRTNILSNVNGILYSQPAQEEMIKSIDNIIEQTYAARQ